MIYSLVETAKANKLKIYEVSVNSGPEKAHRTAICGSPVFHIQ